ncbi:MAG TPA: type VI secretion system tube protein TssD [Edaphobacter sp.]
MAVQIYASFKGAKQGDFRGDSTEKGREGMIIGVGFSYGVISPRDAVSGLPTGKRQEQPIVFTKEWSVCSPQFYLAAYTNETLPSVAFNFYSPDKAALLQLTHTIKLTNATIISVKQSVHLPQSSGPVIDSRELQEITLTFQKIDITSLPNGFEAIDDWQAKV